MDELYPQSLYSKTCFWFSVFALGVAQIGQTQWIFSKKRRVNYGTGQKNEGNVSGASPMLHEERLRYSKWFLDVTNEEDLPTF